MEVIKIQTKPITMRQSFCANPQKDGTVLAGKNITDLSGLPAQKVGINVPVPYTATGELNILGTSKAKTYKLANGQKVVILPKKGPTIVKTYVNVGSMNEPDNLRGISHYIEHNLFNGTETLKAGEFFNKVNKLGASTNASTSFAATDYYISSQLLKEGDLEEKIKMHADMLQNPIFAPDMLEKERGPVISEISMVMDNPQNIAINNAIKNLFQIKTNSADLIAGTVKNIQNITRDDVVNYYNTHYTPDNFITVVTGEVEPEETIKLISKYFTKQNPAKPLPKKYETFTQIEKPVRVDEITEKTKAGYIVTAFAGPQNNNTKDKIALNLLTLILCGSKNAKLKKALEPLNYSTDADLERTGGKETDKSVFLLLSTGSADKIDETLKIIYDELSKLQNGINQSELDNAKKRLSFIISEITENSNSLNNFIGSSLLNNDTQRITNYKELLDGITVEDLKNAAKKYFDLNRVSISVVKPPQKSPAQNVSFGGKYIEKEIYEKGQVKEYKLPNNIDLTTCTNNADKSVLSLSLKTPLPANVKPGTAEILDAILSRGSAFKTKEQFYDEADKNNIEIEFSASADGINAYSVSGAKDAKTALNLAKETINNPNFSRENFEFVKNQMQDALKNKNETAAENAHAELFNYLPFSAPQAELIKSLETVTLEDVIGLYGYIMQNSSCISTVSAPFEKDQKLLYEIAGGLTAGMPVFRPYEPTVFNSYLPLNKNKIITSAQNQNQADIVKCYKFKTNLNLADTAKFALLNIILGGNPNSRLFNDLREKQKLAYRVRSEISYLGNTGVMSLSIKTTTDNPNEGNDKLDNVKKALNGFDRNTAILQTQPVTDEELESAKLYLKTNVLNRAETSSGKTVMLGEDKTTPYGLKNTELLLKEIDKVTKEDIKAAANYIFQNPALTSIVASQKTLNHFKTQN